MPGIVLFDDPARIAGPVVSSLPNLTAMLHARPLPILITFCIGASAFAQPGNDDPCGAVALQIGIVCSAVSASDVGATATPDIPDPGCSNYQGHDVWFSFTAPETGIAQISMFTDTLNGDTLIDGGMALYSATDCSGPFSLVACDDDGGPGLMPLLFRDNLTPGSTYWIRAFGYGTGTGTFSICITGPTTFPIGDCMYRLDLFDSFGDGWTGGSLALSVNGGAPTSYSCVSSHDVYFIGLNSGDVLTLSYIMGTFDADNSYQLQYADHGPLLFRDGPFPQAGLAFTLADGCSTPPPGPPTDCFYRLPVCTDVSFSGDALGTGTSADLHPDNYGCLLAGEQQGIWTELTFATSGTLGLTITPALFGTDMDFAVWGPFEEVVCPMPSSPVRCSFAVPAGTDGTTGLHAAAVDDSEGATGDGLVDTLHVLAGQRYVLYMSNYSNSASPFSLSFQLTGGATLACSAAPEVDFIASANSVLVGEPVSFTDLSTNDPFYWQWSFSGADDDASWQQDPQGITWSLPGCYDVDLTSTNVLGSGTATHPCEIDVSISSGVTSSLPATSFARVIGDQLTVEQPGNVGAWHVALFDASGRTVLTFTASGVRDQRSIAQVPSGIYWLVVSDANGTSPARVLITH